MSDDIHKPGITCLEHYIEVSYPYRMWWTWIWNTLARQKLESRARYLLGLPWFLILNYLHKGKGWLFSSLHTMLVFTGQSLGSHSLGVNPSPPCMSCVFLSKSLVICSKPWLLDFVCARDWTHGFHFYLFFLVGLGFEYGLHILNKYSTTEIHPKPPSLGFCFCTR
jgi:hypothetical protein